MGWRCTGELPFLDTKAQPQGPGGDHASQDRRWRTQKWEPGQGNDLQPQEAGGGECFVVVCLFFSLPVSGEAV